MKITLDKIKINGTELGSENPLPMFHDRIRNRSCSFDESFLEKDKELFGYETGFSVLPYRMQDSYTRDKKEMEMKTIVLENENIKAVFLADYGGRLISLFDKRSNKELLFCNEVFQTANLSVRDAWFSGGIEWNVGQFGHSVQTCEPLFFARMKDDEGHEFLRMYEYERAKRIFYSIDFHLPSGAQQLSAYIRIVNDNIDPVPMYWWTNIAVREEKDIRIFSETDQVIYIKPESNLSESSEHTFGRASIEKLPSLPGKDASRPLNFDFSSEYFFQNPQGDTAPWEAAVYDDGFTFFERSTGRLQFRKMFCWGTHKGGRNWCDYLSSPSKGDYLEIQAGIAPTQLHGLIMPGSTSWDFTQIFGSSSIDNSKTGGSWKSARDYTKSCIEKVLPAQEVNSRHEKYKSYKDKSPVDIISHGSGWGALEEFRRCQKGNKKSIPKGFNFPDSTMGSYQEPWIQLLQSGKMPEVIHEREYPQWMVDPQWKEILENSCKVEKTNPWPLIHLGNLLYENGEEENAVKQWQRSITIKATPIAWRNMAMALKNWGDDDQSINALLRAVALEGPKPDAHITRELLEMLINKKRYNEAWKYYTSLPPELADQERVMTLAAQAAFEKNNDEFLENLFGKSFAYIKEGETRLVDLWYQFQTRKLAKERNMEINEELCYEVRRNCPPPQKIDFTMTERDKK